MKLFPAYHVKRAGSKQDTTDEMLFVWGDLHFFDHFITVVISLVTETDFQSPTNKADQVFILSKMNVILKKLEQTKYEYNLIIT